MNMKKNNCCLVGACPSATVIGDKVIIVGKKVPAPKDAKVADNEEVIEVSLKIIKKALK